MTYDSRINIETEDGTIAGQPSPLKFPNGSLTDNLDGSYSVAFAEAPTLLSQATYVSKLGNDSTGQIGNITKPYLTIQAAIDAITDASSSKVYYVHIMGGNYVENITAKDYVYLLGDEQFNVAVTSSTGPLLTLPANAFRATNMAFRLTPTTNQTAIFGNATTGFAVFDRCQFNITTATSDIQPKMMDIDIEDIRIVRSEATFQSVGTGANTAETKIFQFKNSTFIGINSTSLLCVFAQASGDICVIDDSSDDTCLIANGFATSLSLNPVYSGNLRQFCYLAPSAQTKQIKDFTFLTTGAGSGSNYNVYTNADSVTVQVDNTSFTCSNFGTCYGAYAGHANDIINVDFGVFNDSQLFNGPGTVNKVHTQSGVFRYNTDLVDENLLLGTPTNETVQSLFNILFSAGWVSGGAITDNLDGTIDIAAGTGIIRNANNEQAPVFSFDWSASVGLTLTDQASNIVYIDYNAGSPQVQVTTNRDSILNNENDKFELFDVYRDGTILHITEIFHRSKNVAAKAQEYLYDLFPIRRGGTTGLLLGETGTRNVSVTAGRVWIKLKDVDISAIDTSGADTFDRYYRDGAGGWTKQAAQTQWSNLNYDDGTGTLAAVGASKYSYQDFYIEADGSLVSLFGQNDFTSLAAAETAPTSSSVPGRLEKHGLFIGRITFQQADTTAQSILSAFGLQLNPASVVDHGNLAGLSDDDHTQYLLSLGRSGGQTLIGGVDAGDDLVLRSTSNATLGDILLETVYTAPTVDNAAAPKKYVDDQIAASGFWSRNAVDGYVYPTTSGDVVRAESTGGTASLVANRTDARAASLLAGGANCNFAYDESGGFAIRATTKANVLAGNLATFTKSIYSQGSNGFVGFGTETPRTQADSLSTTGPQFRATYTDNSVYTDFTTNSSGNLLVVPTGGNIYFDAKTVFDQSGTTTKLGPEHHTFKSSDGAVVAVQNTAANASSNLFMYDHLGTLQSTFGWINSGAGVNPSTFAIGTLNATPIRFFTNGNATTQLEIEADGTLNVGTANYETLVTADDDIPNKKYVDDKFSGVNGSFTTTDAKTVTVVNGVITSIV